MRARHLRIVVSSHIFRDPYLLDVTKDVIPTVQFRNFPVTEWVAFLGGNGFNTERVTDPPRALIKLSWLLDQLHVTRVPRPARSACITHTTRTLAGGEKPALLRKPVLVGVLVVFTAQPLNNANKLC